MAAERTQRGVKRHYDDVSRGGRGSDIHGPRAGTRKAHYYLCQYGKDPLLVIATTRHLVPKHAVLSVEDCDYDPQGISPKSRGARLEYFVRSMCGSVLPEPGFDTTHMLELCVELCVHGVKAVYHHVFERICAQLADTETSRHSRPELSDEYDFGFGFDKKCRGAPEEVIQAARLERDLLAHDALVKVLEHFGYFKAMGVEREARVPSFVCRSLIPFHERRQLKRAALRA